ncbi:MAG: hypothetical protein LUD71_04550 [Clostridiales bacterium]|nr:hypothetical protein [Clostridiales bacterium]
MEKVYQKMTYSGAFSVIGGVCAIIIGCFVIISGGMMLKNQNKIIF